MESAASWVVEPTGLPSDLVGNTDYASHLGSYPTPLPLNLGFSSGWSNAVPGIQELLQDVPEQTA